MPDGFVWARIVSKQLRFLYETVTLQPPPQRMYDLAAKIDTPANVAARAPAVPDTAKPSRNAARDAE